MSFSRNVGSALHDFDLLITLEHAHLVQDRRWIDDGPRRFQRFSICLAHDRKLLNEFFIKLRTAIAKRVVEFLWPIQNLRQLCVKLTYVESLVSAVIFLRAFDAGPI